MPGTENSTGQERREKCKELNAKQCKRKCNRRMCKVLHGLQEGRVTFGQNGLESLTEATETMPDIRTGISQTAELLVVGARVLGYREDEKVFIGLYNVELTGILGESV